MSSYVSQSSEPQGCTTRVVALISSAYLFLMVAYLVLRLVFGASFWWLALLNAFAIYTFTPLFILLPLALFSRLWPYVLRLGLLAVLGVFWFGPFFQPSSTGTYSGGTRLDVITYNMLGSENPQVSDVVAWLAESEADLVLIQEHAPEHAEGIETLRDVYPYQETSTNNRLTLSTFPIVEHNDARSVLDVNGQEVVVYNVHFSLPLRSDSRFPDRFSVGLLDFISRYDETQRNQDIEAFLEQIKTETLPVIAAGDYNMSQHSIIYSNVALQLRDSFRVTNTGLGATWPSDFALLRLDYIWHSQSLRALTTSLGPDLGSDHLPMLATLELPPPEDPGLDNIPE